MGGNSSQPNQQGGNSKVRSSNNNPDQANRKDNSKGKVKKLDAAVIADLQKSKLISSQAVSHSRLDVLKSDVKFQDFKQVILPSHAINFPTRESNYAFQLGKVVDQPSLVTELHHLSFAIDDPHGVSEQAEIYHFDYQRNLHKYINWTADAQK